MEAVAARRPGPLGVESQARLGRFQLGLAGDDQPVPAHRDRPRGQGRVQGSADLDQQRVGGPNRRGQTPLGGVDRRPQRRGDGDGLGERLGEEAAPGIAPEGVDLQSEPVADGERRAFVDVVDQAALDPAGIEEDGQAPALRVPEFLVDLHEHAAHRPAACVQHADVLPGDADAHGGGEADVELQHILGPDVGAGSDLQHPGCGRADGLRHAAEPGDHGLAGQGPELGPQPHRGRRDEARGEGHPIGVAAIGAQHRRRGRIFAGEHRQHFAPAAGRRRSGPRAGAEGLAVSDDPRAVLREGQWWSG